MPLFYYEEDLEMYMTGANETVTLDVTDVVKSNFANNSIMIEARDVKSGGYIYFHLSCDEVSLQTATVAVLKRSGHVDGQDLGWITQR